MAVESRFVVIRQDVEVETFMDKKAADDYDKMLDMADNLTELFEQSSIKLSEAIREELSIYLAQSREKVLIALQAKKAKVVKKKPSSADSVNADVKTSAKQKAPTGKTLMTESDDAA